MMDTRKTRELLDQAKEALEKRGEKLAETEIKTEELKHNAENFYKFTKKFIGDRTTYSESDYEILITQDLVNATRFFLDRQQQFSKIPNYNLKHKNQMLQKYLETIRFRYNSALEFASAAEKHITLSTPYAARLANLKEILQDNIALLDKISFDNFVHFSIHNNSIIEPAPQVIKQHTNAEEKNIMNDQSIRIVSNVEMQSVCAEALKEADYAQRLLHNPPNVFENDLIHSQKPSQSRPRRNWCFLFCCVKKPQVEEEPLLKNTFTK